MSEYTDDFSKQLKDVRSVKQATHEIIKKGNKIAFKEIYKQSSFERLNCKLREDNY